MSKAKVFQTNDRIFAKVKGYPAWPACVTGPNDPKGARYKVYFYGTYETAIVKKEDMWFFDDSTKAKFGKQKRKGFSEAIDEIENRPEVGYLTEEALPIPDEHEPLESGTGGDTILEESGVDASMLDEAKDEEPVVTPAIPIPAQAPITKTNAASAKKGAKRKAAADDSPAVTPAAKQAKISTPVASKQPKISTPVTKISKTSTPIVAATPPSTPGGTPSEEKTSRSGRVIKPKKFEDEKETLNQKEKAPHRLSNEKVWHGLGSYAFILFFNLNNTDTQCFRFLDNMGFCIMNKIIPSFTVLNPLENSPFPS